MAYTRYEVFNDNRFDSSHAGLMGACAVARGHAQDQAGHVFEVCCTADGAADINEARYQVKGGKLAAWMR